MTELWSSKQTSTWDLEPSFHLTFGRVVMGHGPRKNLKLLEWIQFFSSLFSLTLRDRMGVMGSMCSLHEKWWVHSNALFHVLCLHFILHRLPSVNIGCVYYCENEKLWAVFTTRTCSFLHFHVLHLGTEVTADMILSLYEADQFVIIQMIRGHCLFLKEKYVCFCFRITIKAGFHFISCKHFNIFTRLSSRSDIWRGWFSEMLI